MAKRLTTKSEPVERVEGVPRDSPSRNCLPILEATLATVLGRKRAQLTIAGVKSAGYFDLALLDQGRLLVRHVVALGEAARVTEALISSESDRMRALGVSVHFEHFKEEIGRELEALKLSSALPGTWTQETSQSVLKSMVHHHGLSIILPRVAGWVYEPDPAVRRAVAEALRPRGVWCKHITELKDDPTPIKELLETLLDDESVYVQKAVANNLNDISKDNPELLCRWVAARKKGSISKARQWIIEQALRTLIKEYHPAAMKLMGLGDSKDIVVKWRSGTPSEIKIGNRVRFDLDVVNKASVAAKVRLQVIMAGPGKNGSVRKAKYLLGSAMVPGNGGAVVSKAVKFEHRNSVSKIAGVYRWTVMCNGRIVGERESVYRGRDLKGRDSRSEQDRKGG